MSDSDVRFDALVADALNAAFSGWDWSWLGDRWRISPLPWDYTAEARRALAGAACALDQGTGGGEVLSSLAPFPSQMVATEGWVRNAPIAAARLRPLGAPVVRVDSAAPQPFPDACFDLVINRHDGYAPAELARILIPGGRFLTQQVGGHNNAELNALLACPIPFEYGYWTAEYAAAELERGGLVVERVEETLRETTVADIGAVVYYLRAIPWQIADFDVEAYRERLLALHHRIEHDGGLVVHEHRFLIAARNVKT